jgi:hypothetical protein
MLQQCDLMLKFLQFYDNLCRIASWFCRSGCTVRLFLLATAYSRPEPLTSTSYRYATHYTTNHWTSYKLNLAGVRNHCSTHSANVHTYKSTSWTYKQKLYLHILYITLQQFQASLHSLHLALGPRLALLPVSWLSRRWYKSDALICRCLELTEHIWRDIPAACLHAPTSL